MFKASKELSCGQTLCDGFLGILSFMVTEIDYLHPDLF